MGRQKALDRLQDAIDGTVRLSPDQWWDLALDADLGEEVAQAYFSAAGPGPAGRRR